MKDPQAKTHKTHKNPEIIEILYDEPNETESIGGEDKILVSSFSIVSYYNGSQLKNRDISGALYTLRIQYCYTQTQCEDGARDVRVL